MPNIRETKTGLIAFGTSIITVITGLMFALIITRTLTPEEFGTWNEILSLVSYSLIIEPMISWWTTRDVARGEEIGKTAVITNGVSSIGGSFIFLVIAYLLTQQSNVEQDIIFLSIILVPLSFLKNTLYAINYGWKPQAASYSLLILEIVKVPLGLYFVYFLQMGVPGVIIAFVIAYTLQICVLTYFAKIKISNKFQKKFVKKWIKNSFLAVYLNVISVTTRLDIIIFVLIIDSVSGVAIFVAAMIVASLTGNAATVSSSTYPKLLAGDRGVYLQRSITRLFYFSIPLAFISIFFAKSALFVLNPLYAMAGIVVIFLTIRTFLNGITIVFTGYIYGEEKVDAKMDIKFKDQIKSSMFTVSTVKLIINGSYLISLIVGLIVLKQNLVSELDLIIFWSSMALITIIPYTIYIYLRVKKSLKIKLETRNILKYFLSGIISFAIPFLISENLLEYSDNVFEFIFELSIFILLGIGIYIFITYIIDLRTKELIKNIIQELKNK